MAAMSTPADCQLFLSTLASPVGVVLSLNTAMDRRDSLLEVEMAALQHDLVLDKTPVPQPSLTAVEKARACQISSFGPMLGEKNLVQSMWVRKQ